MLSGCDFSDLAASCLSHWVIHAAANELETYVSDLLRWCYLIHLPDSLRWCYLIHWCGVTWFTDVVLPDSLRWCYLIHRGGVTCNHWGGVTWFTDVVLPDSLRWCYLIHWGGVTCNHWGGVTWFTEVVLPDSLMWCYLIHWCGVTWFTEVVLPAITGGVPFFECMIIMHFHYFFSVSILCHAGLPACLLNRLQSVLCAAARLVFSLPGRAPVMSGLPVTLRWLS